MSTTDEARTALDRNPVLRCEIWHGRPSLLMTGKKNNIQNFHTVEHQRFLDICVRLYTSSHTGLFFLAVSSELSYRAAKCNVTHQENYILHKWVTMDYKNS